MQIIQKSLDFNINLQNIEKMSLPNNVLMVTPTYFSLDNPINVHMLDAHGKPHRLNKTKAQDQWEHLKSIYEKLNFKVSVIKGIPNLPDMVFCANQSLPYLDKTNHTHALLSNMENETRHLEVEHINSFLKSQNYSTQTIAKRSRKTLFEGMGDVGWLSQSRFLLGGYGFRTDKSIFPTLSRIVEAPVAIFELKNPKFYHFDTCLCILNSTTALVCKEAFTPQGFELLQAIFSNLLVVPLSVADAPGFACNAHCPNGKHVILQKGNIHTISLLKQHNFIPIEVDTSEFIKSGGSVYCMKLMYF